MAKDPIRKPVPAKKKPLSNERPNLRGEPTRGRITKILHGQGYGYIRADDDRDVYFHRADVPGGFNDLGVGDRVTFELYEDKITGPRALHLRKKV
jgi:cold shock CspA family protein